MFKQFENNEVVTFELIEALECEISVIVADMGMSGQAINKRWFILEDVKTGEKKNLYVKI